MEGAVPGRDVPPALRARKGYGIQIPVSCIAFGLLGVVVGDDEAEALGRAPDTYRVYWLSRLPARAVEDGEPRRIERARVRQGAASDGSSGRTSRFQFLLSDERTDVSALEDA